MHHEIIRIRGIILQLCKQKVYYYRVVKWTEQFILLLVQFYSANMSLCTMITLNTILDMIDSD